MAKALFVEKCAIAAAEIAQPELRRFEFHFAMVPRHVRKRPLKGRGSDFLGGDGSQVRRVYLALVWIVAQTSGNKSDRSLPAGRAGSTVRMCLT